MSSETLTSYWTTSAVNSVALGTRLTSKSADRATLVRDLLNLVPTTTSRCSYWAAILAPHCAHGFRSTASTLLKEEARSTAM